MAHILAVDDANWIRKMVCMTLESAGHQVTAAEDGAQALNLLKTTKPDMIVTDIHMPVMNGIEFIKCTRELETHRFTPILVLTTESSTEFKQKGKSAGATGWIVKPFSPEKLLLLISRVLDR